jgi:hypothetical protein
MMQQIIMGGSLPIPLQLMLSMMMREEFEHTLQVTWGVHMTTEYGRI